MTTELIPIPEDSKLYDTYATFILAAHNMIELIDAMAGTNMYKQDLKQQLNRVLKILDTPEYYAKINSTTSDWDAFKNLTDHFKRAYKKMAHLTPQWFAVHSEAVSKLVDNPQLFAALINVNIGSSDDLSLLTAKEEIGGIVGVLNANQVATLRKYIDNVLIPNSKTITNEHSCSDKQLAG